MPSEEEPDCQMFDSARDALEAVRVAIVELYVAAGANPDEPQEVARRFGLNRNLTWKLARVVAVAQPFAMLDHLPGKQGMELALLAFAKANAPKGAIDRVERALRQLYRVIEHHAGDREHLELSLESMGLIDREDHPGSGREQAFRGNSMVWGVQARTRLSASFLGPSASANCADLVQLGGLYRFRRLRTSARWRLFCLQITDDKGKESPSNQGPEEVDLNKRPGDPPLVLPDFCSGQVPQVEATDTSDGREFALAGGPVGNRGTFDCAFGFIARGLPSFRIPGHEHARLGVSITTPVENLILDFFVHRDLPVPLDPSFELYGFPHGGLEDVSMQIPANQLALTEEPVRLEGSPPVVATPLVSKYASLAARAYSRMGWNASEFRGLRLHVKFPPLATRYVVKWELK